MTKFVIYNKRGVDGIFSSAKEAKADIKENSPNDGFKVAPATEALLAEVRDGGGGGIEWQLLPDGRLDLTENYKAELARIEAEDKAAGF